MDVSVTIGRRIRDLLVAGLVLGSLPFASTICHAQPTAGEFTSQAKRCRRLLAQSVVDFYLPHCLDKQHGGYLEELDANGAFSAGHGKFLTLQARQLWLFSTLTLNDIQADEALVAARSGYNFIQKNFKDKQRGGYISRVADDGSPDDTRKHVYHNAFVIYALVAYYRASGDNQALQAALHQFEVLDKNAHDKQLGGYQEFFYADWTPITDPNEPTYVGAIGTKTYNTHLHLLESFSALHRVARTPKIERRLTELVTINTLTVRHPKYACNIDGWSRDWQMIDSPKNLRASFGHDVECAWLVLDAIRTLDRPVEPLRGWAESLVGYSLDHGFDHQHGGFYNTGPVGQDATAREKVWWVESEALVCLLEMYALTGDSRYYGAFVKTLDFIEQHQIAAKEGGWWATRQEDGSADKNRSRTSTWHGGYHNGRALLRSAKLLDQLSAK